MMDNILGTKGIFICDDCRVKLKVNIDEATFNAMKDEINKKPTDIQCRCYLCSQMKYENNGLKIGKEMMADSIQKHIEKSEELYNLYKDNKVICTACGSVIESKDKFVTCPKCNIGINTKEYGKRIKMGLSTKITLKLYVKMLRGKSTIPGDNL